MLVRRVASLLAAGVVTVDRARGDHVHREGGGRAVDPGARRARARAANESTDEEQRPRLLDAARDLYRAHIETIHSFATALLRERPVEAGIDPLFEVLEGLAAGLDFDEAYERFQDELLASDDPDLERALRRGFGLAGAARGVRAPARAPLPAPARASAAAPAASLDETLDELARRSPHELRALMRTHSPEDKLVDVVRADRRVGRRSGRARRRRARAAARLRRHGRRRNKGVGLGRELGRARSSAVKELQDSYEDDARRAKLSAAHRRAARAAAAHRAVRARVRGTTASGAARPTSTTCCSGRATCCATTRAGARYFRGRFRARADRRVPGHRPGAGRARAAPDQRSRTPARTGATLTPGPGRLTVVGDPKQSIYRFRRADIAVYDEVKTGALAGVERADLTNFRSNEQLLRALNPAFDAMLYGRARACSRPTSSYSRRRRRRACDGRRC